MSKQARGGRFIALERGAEDPEPEASVIEITSKPRGCPLRDAIPAEQFQKLANWLAERGLVMNHAA